MLVPGSLKKKQAANAWTGPRPETALYGSLPKPVVAKDVGQNHSQAKCHPVEELTASVARIWKVGCRVSV